MYSNYFQLQGHNLKIYHQNLFSLVLNKSVRIVLNLMSTFDDPSTEKKDQRVADFYERDVRNVDEKAALVYVVYYKSEML